ncbi:MAG: GNAT family N-acetyltransferase [Pseudomonadota bacterium]
MILRRASASDADACAAILNDWIDQTPWMPRIHSPADVTRHYRQTVLPKRDVRVAGDPPQGFIAIDDTDGLVTALYVAATARGGGLGTRLIADAKRRHGHLRLWTFAANSRARRFYRGQGFEEVDRTDGENEENLPDILLTWPGHAR